MSDQPQPRQPVREPPPAHIEEEPLRQPPYPDDDWDGEHDEDDAPARNWDGRGWPSIEQWWP
jgi:hypothetical protein